MSKEKKEEQHFDASKKTDFASKWKRNTQRSRKVKGTMPIRTLIIILVLLFIFMYVLDKKYM